MLRARPPPLVPERPAHKPGRRRGCSGIPRVGHDRRMDVPRDRHSARPQLVREVGRVLQSALNLRAPTHAAGPDFNAHGQQAPLDIADGGANVVHIKDHAGVVFLIGDCAFGVTRIGKRIDVVTSIGVPAGTRRNGLPILNSSHAAQVVWPSAGQRRAHKSARGHIGDRARLVASMGARTNSAASIGEQPRTRRNVLSILDLVHTVKIVQTSPAQRSGHACRRPVAIP